MKIPSFQDAVKQAQTTFTNEPISEGVHTFTLKELEASKTKNTEKDMMIAVFLVDSGPDAGRTIKEYLVDDFGFNKLAVICAAGGFQWQIFEGMTFERFVSQFSVVLGKLRFQARIWHKSETYNGETKVRENIAYADVTAATVAPTIQVAPQAPVQQYQAPAQPIQQAQYAQPVQYTQPAFSEDLPF